MYGAILGDIIGSPYEFMRGKEKIAFPLLTWRSRFTDDTVMTVAVAEALSRAADEGLLEDETAVKNLLVDEMKKWGRQFPDAGYGGRFFGWLMSDNREPYNSFGNGSAMRVSPAGWISDDLDEVRKIARWTAEVTHNHIEGIKGAESTAAAICLARNGHDKAFIKDYITREFGYDLEMTCDEIRPGYSFNETCQGSVPESIICFLEGGSYEETVRLAVSLGGDTDTMACIAGSIAEAYWGLPEDLKDECLKRIPDSMKTTAEGFFRRFAR